MLDAASNILAPNLHVPPKFAFEIGSAVTRLLHGDRLADELGVQRTWVSHLLPALTAMNRSRRWLERRSATVRKASIAATIATLAEKSKEIGTTTYQHAGRHPDPDSLPRTRVPDLASEPRRRTAQP
jgi:hypothetical protein